MQIRRPKKRYGPIRNRGVRKPPWTKAEAKPPKNYLIEAGTVCWVRKMRAKEWRQHTTKKELTCSHFLWRNESCYGFAQGEWEIKVPIGSFKAIW